MGMHLRRRRARPCSAPPGCVAVPWLCCGCAMAVRLCHGCIRASQSLHRPCARGPPGAHVPNPPCGQLLPAYVMYDAFLPVSVSPGGRRPSRQPQGRVFMRLHGVCACGAHGVSLCGRMAHAVVWCAWRVLAGSLHASYPNTGGAHAERRWPPRARSPILAQYRCYPCAAALAASCADCVTCASARACSTQVVLMLKSSDRIAHDLELLTAHAPDGSELPAAAAQVAEASAPASQAAPPQAPPQVCGVAAHEGLRAGECMWEDVRKRAHGTAGTRGCVQEGVHERWGAGGRA